MMMNSKDIDSKRPTLFLLGLISALSLTLMAFEWRTSKYSTSYHFDLGPDDGFIEKVMPAVIIEKEQRAEVITFQNMRKVPRNKQFVVVPDEMQLMDKGPAPIMLKLSATKHSSERTLSRAVDRSPATTRSVRGLLPHELPYLRVCGHIKDDVERFQCTQVELRKHVISNFRMPSSDQLEKLPGRVEVSFTIDRHGKITDITSDKVYHSILSVEIGRVMGGLPEMVPATVAGERIEVRFELPIILERY